MNGYKNASMPREVEKLFEGMQASSKHSKPDVVTLNILLDMYCKRGDHRTAEHLLNEMKESSIYPNTTSYNTLMNGYAVSHDLENCTRIFEGMKNDGSRPDAYTYTILISATGYAGKLTACDELYSEMAGLGVEPTLVTYSTLMDVNNAAANPTQVQKYFDIFTSKGYRPSSRIMWILMDSCRQSRKFDKLKELFEKARELDFVQAPFCHLMMCTFSNPVSDLAKLMHANHVAPTHRTLKLMLEGATAADKPVISLTYSKLASSAIPASLEMQYRDFCAKQ